MAASFRYDVFVSYAGDDTGKTFLGHLKAPLYRLRVFEDKTHLEGEEAIGPGLIRAIKQSKLFIIIFSKGYTSSKWCLDELVEIMEWRRQQHRTVIPIFYHGRPSDVRKQESFYAIAEMLGGRESRTKWTLALTEAGKTPGYVLENINNGCERTLIERVVRQVTRALNPKHLNVGRHPVGLDQRLLELLDNCLKLGQSGKKGRIVAIVGFDGIGKTTIAKELYNRLHLDFESSSFLADVGPTSKQNKSSVELQKNLLRDLVDDRDPQITNEANGIEVLKRRVWSQRVLVVLDDVDNKFQLEALAIDRNSLLPGSRIIITTRDLSSLSSLGLQKDELYEVRELNEEDSLELFKWHAFEAPKRRHLVESYKSLSEEAVNYATGVPFVLECLGSFLSDKTRSEWRSELDRLKTIPLDVDGKLWLNLDALNDKQMGVFLDIAFFFVGMDKDLAIEILKACGFSPEIDIKVLSRRYLLSTDLRNRLVMPDLIKKLAKERVRQAFTDEPGNRSRLWNHEDILHVLECDTGSEAVLGLILNMPEPNREQLEEQGTGNLTESEEELERKVQEKVMAFKKMKCLRLLNLNYVQLSQGYENFSEILVWLSWKGFSSPHIPSTLIMNNLVIVDLSYSKLEQVWNAEKALPKLKHLNLSHCYFLIKTPNFKEFKSLEKLLLNDCTNLVKVHKSIRRLENLVFLDLKNCLCLKKIPSIFALKSLLYLDLSGCSRLDWEAFFRRSEPESSSSSSQFSGRIRKLYMESCNITHLPSNIGSLMSLEFLNLNSNNFSDLPPTIANLLLLKAVYLNQCTSLQSIPALPRKLLGLSALYCTSLRSCSLESRVEEAPFMTFYGCDNLAESNFASDFRSNLLHCQEMPEQGELNVFLPGKEVPEWCNYHAVSNVIHFIVPADRVIQGFILCVVFSGATIDEDDDDNDEDDDDDKDNSFSIGYTISKKKKLGGGLYGAPRVDFYPLLEEDEDQIWLSYVPNASLKLMKKPTGKKKNEPEGCSYDGQLAGGDEVEIKVHLSFEWKVKMCGVSLVYEGDEHNPDAYDASNIIDASGDYFSEDGYLQPDRQVTDAQFLREIGMIKGRYY